jgi:hypothetical protein
MFIYVWPAPFAYDRIDLKNFNTDRVVEESHQYGSYIDELMDYVCGICLAVGIRLQHHYLCLQLSSCVNRCEINIIY